MTSALETVRRELAQAELDDGLVVFGWLMLATLLGLLTLAKALGGALSWVVAVPVVVALVGLGPVVRAWQQRRRVRRLERTWQLDWATLQRCAAAPELEPELAAAVADGFRVVFTIAGLVRNDVWQRAGLDVAVEVEGVCAALRALVAQAERAQSLHELTCGPAGEAAGAPYRRAKEDLDRRVAELEEVLVAVAEGWSAVLQREGELAAGVESRLRRMAEGLAGLDAAAEEQGDGGAAAVRGPCALRSRI